MISGVKYMAAGLHLVYKAPYTGRCWLFFFRVGAWWSQQLQTWGISMNVLVL